MRFNHKDTWTISLDSSSDLDLALYVRDALNITSLAAGSIPPLDPAVQASDGLRRNYSRWAADLRAAEARSGQPHP